MALLGINDMKQFALPTGWDGSELSKYSLVDGTTYEQIVNNIAAALSVANGDLISDPMYGGLITVTDELGKEYRDGVSNGMQERGEYTKADARRARTIGHMLPIKSYDRVLGWTWDFLRKARNVQIEADIASAIYDVKDNFQKRSLTRFFSTTENTIGTSGYDVPFVNSTGGNVDYTPPPYNGSTFASTHTHFDRKGTSNHADALEAGAGHLYEHGIMGDYTAMIPLADIATYTALTNFAKPDPSWRFIRTDSAANWAVANVQDGYVGVYQSKYGLINVWATPRIPTAYLGVYKSYGVNDPRNSLAVRYSPDMGVGAVLMASTASTYPLADATIMHEFGVGVNDRLNGYACYFNSSGSYTDPTIS